jgi:hypothetical protein
MCDSAVTARCLETSPFLVQAIAVLFVATPEASVHGRPYDSASV